MSDADDDIEQLRQGLERLKNNFTFRPKKTTMVLGKNKFSRDTPKSGSGKKGCQVIKSSADKGGKLSLSGGRRASVSTTSRGTQLPPSSAARVVGNKKAASRPETCNGRSRSRDSFASRIQKAERHKGLVTQLEAVTRDLKLLSSGMEENAINYSTRKPSGCEVIEVIVRRTPARRSDVFSLTYECAFLKTADPSCLCHAMPRHQGELGVAHAELDRFLRDRQRRSQDSWAEAGRRLMEDSDDDADLFENCRVRSPLHDDLIMLHEEQVVVTLYPSVVITTATIFL
jgi:hypothetical protein